MKIFYLAFTGVVLLISASTADVTRTWRAVFTGPVANGPKWF